MTVLFAPASSAFPSARVLCPLTYPVVTVLANEPHTGPLATWHNDLHVRTLRSRLNPSGTTAAVIVTTTVSSCCSTPEGGLDQTHRVDKVIVVDNGCQDEVRVLLEDLAGDRAVYVPSKTNLGGGGGFALGFLTALSLGVDAVWCADDDGRPADENVLATLYDVAARHQLAEVSPAVCNIAEPERLAFPLRQGVVWRRYLHELEGDFLPGIASLFNGALLSAKAMEVIGVPDYRLFIRGDEVEYHRRLVRSGLAFGTCLTTSYLHPDGADEFSRSSVGGCTRSTRTMSRSATSPTATAAT